MHISKEGETRKKELMDAALMVFCKKGYEVSSVQDIIDTVGVTRGAFYHYFDSKEEIMRLIAYQQAENVIDICRNITEDKDLNAFEQLEKCFTALLEFKVANKEKWVQITEALYKYEENIRLRGIIDKKVKCELIPVFIDIIERGEKEGVFTTTYSEEIAEMICVLGFHYTIVKFDFFKNRKKMEAEKALRSRMLFLLEMLENNLGLQPGSFDILEQIETSIAEISDSVFSYYIKKDKAEEDYGVKKQKEQ